MAFLLGGPAAPAQTPVLLRDLDTTPRLDSLPSQFFESPRGETWFTAYPSQATAPALYLTHGTDATTSVVTNLHTLYLPPFVFTDDWLGYFVNFDAATGWELWRSDGTAAGTTLVTDFAAGPQSSLPRELTVCAGELYHTAYDPAFGYELCRRGVRIADLWSGPGSSHPTGLTRAGNSLFFAADNGVHGRELWVLPWRDPKNPNPQPRLVRDIRPGAAGSDPMSLVAFGNVLYFTADDGVRGRELWRSNGVGSGTLLVKDIYPGPGHGIPDGQLVSSDSRLFFVGEEPATGREPWFSTGHVEGTNLLADLRPGPVGSDPRDLTVIHYDRIALSADDGISGRELWLTPLSRQPVLIELVPGPVGSHPSDLFWSSDDLYFAATDALTGTEPWSAASIELTSARRLADLRPGIAGSRPPGGYAFAIAHRHLIFRADDGSRGIEPWVMDAGGVSRRFGQGCGGETRQPRLHATAPHVGRNVQYSGFGLVTTTDAFALIWLSARPLAPVNLGLCKLQLDPFTMFLLTIHQARTSFNAVLPIPNAPHLVGVVLRVGALTVPSTDPEFGFDLMNVVDLRVGL